MHYDPIKRSLGRLFDRWLFSRRLFYRLLDILLLRAWHIHRELQTYFRHTPAKTGVNVLDAGSGFGQYTYFIARKKPGWTIHGIDIKVEELASCERFFKRSRIENVVFSELDITRLSAKASYDLIISIDVMEHIEEDILVLSNFHASLKPGGLLLINTPSDKGGSDVSAADDMSFIEEHVRDGYGMEEMQNKLHQAGFSKIQMYYTYGWPGHISWLLSMKYPILMLGHSRFFLLLLPFYYFLTLPFALILNLIDVRLKHTSGTGLLVKAWR